jgi:DNA-binding MarR family transcriptional regulator
MAHASPRSPAGGHPGRAHASRRSRGAAPPSSEQDDRPLALEADRLLGLLTTLLSSTFRQILWRKAAELDLTFSQAQILFHVARNPGCPTGDVARAFSITLPAVTQLVERLEQKGFVARGADPADRRVSTLALTAAGESLVAELQRLQREALEAVLGRMSPPDRDRVIEGLEAFVRAATTPSPEGPEA